MCPDLRGYGESGKPSSSDDHTPYSKRSMAADVIALMLALGHERFAVVGHDRGSYVAYRTALDHPGAVDRLVVMDGVPVIEALERCSPRCGGTGSSSAKRRNRPSGSSARIPRPGTKRGPTGHGIDSTHHIAEQAPGELVRSLQEFLSAR
jgi:pimeloyl-ACP methyl ester carboxylesterase